MSRPVPIVVAKRLAIAALALVVCGCREQSEPPRRTQIGRPNIVLVTIDTLRADRLPAYGYAAGSTPTFDRLARDGVLFEHASTCIPRTTQALASLFTSRYPREHGVVEIGERLRGEETTLAEELRAAGYATAGFSATRVASRVQGLDQGFELFVDPFTPEVVRREGEESTALDATMAALAAGWLESVHREPFFLWLHLMAPHFPYQPPARFSPGLDAGTFWYYHAPDAPEFDRATIYYDLDGRSSRALPELSRLYDGEIAYADTLLGQVLARLDAGGLGPTAVVVTADHGESLGERGYFYEHGDFVFDNTMQIPLIAKLPGVFEAGRRIEDPVSILDVRPTLLALAGLEPESEVGRGSDLGDAMRGATLAERVLMMESGSAFFPQNPRRFVGGRRTGGPEHAFRFLRDGQWVLMRRPGSDDALFDLSTDPRLERDLAAARSERARDLGTRLDRLGPLAGRWLAARLGTWKLVAMPGPERLEWALYDTASDPGETTEVGDSAPEIRRRLQVALRDWLDSQSVQPAAANRDDEALARDLRALGYLP